MNSHADVRCHFTKAAEGIVYLNPEQELPSFDDVRAVIIEMLDINTDSPAGCAGVRQLLAFPDFPAFFAHVRSYFHYDAEDTGHQVECDEPLFEVMFNAMRDEFDLASRPAADLTTEVRGSIDLGVH